MATNNTTTQAQLQPSDITLTRVKRDINGNPRYVVHFWVFLTPKENGYGKEYHEGIQYHSGNPYGLAISRARTIGGSKYRGKDFGGGIVFQSYNTDELKKDICNLVNNL